MQRDAPHHLAVDLEHPVILHLLENLGARPPHQFLAVHRLPDERHDGPHVFFENFPDLLVFVRVDHRADPLVAENLVEQGLVDRAVENMDPRHALPAGLGAVVDLRVKIRRLAVLPLFQQVLGLDNAELPRQ